MLLFLSLTGIILSVILLVFINHPLLVSGYAIGSSVIFIQWLKNRKNRTVLSYQRYMISWLTVLLAFVFILTINHLIAMTVAYLSHNLKVFFTLRLLHLFSGVGLTGLLISPLFFPSILYGIPRIPGSSPAVTPPVPNLIPDPNPLSLVPEESLKRGFEADYLKQIGSKMDECMHQVQHHLDRFLVVTPCSASFVNRIQNKSAESIQNK